MKIVKKLLKFFRNSAIVLVIFGVVFSNIPFYMLSGAIEGYIKTGNIVDRAWRLSQDDNVVDKFTSLRNLKEGWKIEEARAATAPVWIANGTFAAGAAAITPALPSGIQTDDILLLFVETGAQAVSITNQGGGTWTEVTNSPQTAGVAGTAGTRLTAFWSRYNGTQGNPSLGDSGDHQFARISAYSGVITTGDPWDVTAGGVEAVADNSGSIPGAITTVDNTLVVTAIATALPDGNSTTVFSGWANANLSSLTEQSDNAKNTNNGGALGVASGEKVTAGNYGATAVTVSTNTYKAMMSIALKPAPPPADTTPPTPDPMTFASAPSNTSASQIDMTATTATDATTPPVSYYFALDTTSCVVANIGAGAADSGWQAGTTYSDIGLDVNKCYGYKVKARDSVGTPNETGYSGITTLYTSANTPSAPTVGSPTETTLVITNNENGNPLSNPTTSFAVQVTTADANWNGKWVDATGNASVSEVWLTDTQLTSLTVNGLTGGTLYNFQSKARNEDGDQTALSTAGSGTTSAPSYITTISNFVTAEPSNATIAPGASALVDSFGLQTDGSTDTVTAATIGIAAGMGQYIQTVAITNDGDTVTYCSATPSGDSASLSTCGIPVSITNTQFKIKLTAKAHGSMPVPPGASYAITATVTGFTSGNATQAGTDSGSATMTLDNLSPNGATSVSGTAGDTANTINWTASNSADFNTTSGSVVLRWASGTAGSEVPAEGSAYSAGNTITTATVACVISSTASAVQSKIDGTGGSAGCTTTALTNGQAYTYKVFSRDTNGNYDVGVAIGTFTPAATPPNATSFTNSTESGLNNLGARVGQTIVITGTNFGADPGAANRSTATNNVKVGTYQIPTANVTAWSAASITFNIPSAITVYGNNLTVTANSQADTTPLSFKVYPDITSISPSGVGEAKEGDTVTITGTRFGTTQGTNKVTIDGVAATISTWGDTSIQAVVPSAINDANNSVTVVAYQGTEGDNTLSDNSAGFIILPKITSWPGGDAAKENDSITFGGNHFGATAGTIDFVGGFGAAVPATGGITWSDTSITVTVPTTLSDSIYLGDIRITRNSDSKTGLAYSADGFRILPRIISLTPNTGPNGQSTTIAGDHLCQTGACPSAVTFNTTPDDGNDVKWGTANATVTGIPTHIEIIANAPTLTNGGYSVTVTTGGGSPYTSNGLTFTIANDTTPPTPDPMTFATAPSNTSATQIDMTATTATDATTPPVSYYFALDTTACVGANVGIGAADSGWQAGTTYSDTGLSVNKCYGYKVKARDNAGTPNETGYSGITTLYTSANTPTAPAVGSPTETTLVITNNENGNPLSNPVTNFAVQVTTADANWNGKWVNALGNASVTEVWLTDTQLTSLTINGLTAGTLYDFQSKAKNEDGDQTGLSTAGSGTTSAPPQVTAASSGTQTVNLDSGATGQYVGAAFTFQQTSGSADTITALTISEAGTVNANANLSANAGIRYESGVATCAYNGTETLVSDTFDVTTDKMTLSGLSIPVTVGSNYTCVYVVFDIAMGAVGGQAIDLEITSSTDFTLQNGTTKAGTYPVQLSGSTTIRPNVTSYDNISEAVLNNLGARNGQNITITGAGFGTVCGSISIQVEGTTLTCNNANNTTISATIPSTQVTTYGGTAASGKGLLATVGGTQDDARRDFYIYPEVTNIPTQAREADNINIDGKRFGVTEGAVNFIGNFGDILVPAVDVTWSDTAITVVVPTSIADNVYLGDIKITRAADTGSKEDNAYDSNGFRVLPKITEFNPVNPAVGDNVEIIGNHLCQAGAASCPGALDADNKITFYNAVDATLLNTWANGDSSTVGVNVKVPTGAASGNVVVKSNGYDSNALNLTLLSNTPSNPSVLDQFKNSGYTDSISVGGAASSTTIYFQMTMQASVSGGTLYPQIEAKAVGVAFTNAVTAEGTGQAGPGPATGQVSTVLSTNTQYHWQARVCHNKGGTHTSACDGTGDYPSDWVSFGGNTDPNDVDFYIDATAPAITTSCPMHGSLTAGGATIIWYLTDAMSSTFTKQVQYSTTTNFTSSVCSQGSGNETCGAPSSGYNSDPQQIILTGLSPDTVYYYRARSKDEAGNETSKGYGLGGDTSCTFTTSKAETRTTEFFVTSKQTALNQSDGQYSQTFTAQIPESGYNIKSAFVEITGVFSTDSAPPSQVTVQVNSATAATYTVGTATGATTPFAIIHEVSASDLNIATPSNPTNSNTLKVTVVDASTNITALSAKIVVTYYHTPVQ